MGVPIWAARAYAFHLNIWNIRLSDQLEVLGKTQICSNTVEVSRTFRGWAWTSGALEIFGICISVDVIEPASPGGLQGCDKIQKSSYSNFNSYFEQDRGISIQ